MRVWRICRKAHGADPLNGQGGLAVSGRWHSSGRRVVYTSSSLALATMEILVHLDPAEFPSDLIQVEIEVPDSLEIRRISAQALPGKWRAYPGPDALQALGNDWLESGETPVLQVPSAVIPEEHNYLLNPQHPQAGKIRVVRIRGFVFDPRLQA